MKMKHVVRMSMLTLAAVVTVPLLAHSGGLDKNGCHTNRKTGDYHCHGGGAAAPTAPSAPHAVAAPVAREAGSRSPAIAYLSAPAGAPEPDQQVLVRAAQLLLRGLGYHPTLLGSLDTRTKEAIEAFQASNELPPDGTVSPTLLLHLAASASQKCR